MAGIEKENIDVAGMGMNWSFQKKAPLPLKDAIGFKTMMQQVQGLKEPDTAIIIIALPLTTNKSRRKGQAEENDLEVSTCLQDNGTPYGTKVSRLSARTNTDLLTNSRVSFLLMNSWYQLLRNLPKCTHLVLVPHIQTFVAFSNNHKDGILI